MFKSRDSSFREISVSNTVELTSPSARSSVFKRTSITNTNLEKIKVTRSESDTASDLCKIMRLLPDAFVRRKYL